MNTTLTFRKSLQLLMLINLFDFYKLLLVKKKKGKNVA